ncbi:Glycogen biosynthesis protein GlgD [Sporomusa ovata DSM 2662]|uniref:Glycogen biosynthesis protein GlgD, glucose-1-phosphate adenylyltransferase family n=1 Tax=Sporomusa ovata TaxID=2378 RepID=A0A0U1KZ54_9FIRM|nr:glucose-1-phosphate adenylyltransferase subunit GlgD [Sporomusa ovata]EQB27764.1 glycogen biosynthesis protein GlgD [Sporomusa ovata DSM 2662]CQR72692.1 Glycogen biosynthesis protein GlgD, glucose-1-phosphate adenylyltransferase family [Sporomusa ovata]
MLKNTMGIINLHESHESFREITKHRPLAAIPFAGRYRLIDFVLSNFINSGITNVGILSAGNSRALFDHIRSGKEWDLARKRDGLFLLPSWQTGNVQGAFPNDLADFFSNLDYIKSSRQRFALLSGSRAVCNINYEAAYNYHLMKAADITVLYKEYSIDEAKGLSEATMLETDSDGRVVDMEVCPVNPRSNKLSLEMVILERQLLVDLIDASVSRGGTNFTRDCIMRDMENLKIYGFPFTGYLARIDSMQNYFDHSMKLLTPKIWQEIFFAHGSIYTKVKDEAPAKYQRDAMVKSSLVANGSVIAGKVENSVLFRGVKVHKDARVTNSIVMQKGEIGPGAVIENVICDKDVKITAGKKLKGELNHPIVIEKGTVI